MRHAPYAAMIRIALLLVIFSAAFFYFLPHKIIGSFEYVRKGEDFLNKGRYPQAVGYFEKAHESSPDNDAIKSSLIYAYSVYSNALAGEKRYDEAIRYMDKSFNINPNSSTAQNLAIGYSEKALAEANKGSFQSAKDNYANARKYASMWGGSSRGLGIALYNDGISEFRSGREEAAILCFKESSFIYKDARTFELLGDIYYKHADLRMARFYWHEAMLHDPGNAALPAKIKKAAKEMRVAAKDPASELPHFEIRYAEGIAIERDVAAKTLEEAYSDIGKDLGYFPKAKTKVFFYSTRSFRHIFNMPYFVKAFYDGSIKMPAPETYIDKEKFAVYIYHEYAHAIVSAKTNNNCPLWFSEGIAVWQEFKRGRVDMKKISANIREMPEISFRFLTEGFNSDERNDKKSIHYLLSYTLVDFILNEWGIKGLQGVLRRLSGKQHIANAIDDEFLISEGEFEKKWRDYAVENFFKNLLK